MRSEEIDVNRVWSSLAIAFTAAFLTSLNAEARECNQMRESKEHGWNPKSADLTPRLTSFYAMSGKMSAAYNAKDWSKATIAANEYIAEAAYYRCNWNYGNAIHDANVVLGMYAIDQKDITLAAAYLRRAGASPGSPQLNSFGPTLILAKAVYDNGDRDAVIAYLDAISRFWKMDNGQIFSLKKQMLDGKTPSFTSFNLRAPI
jgi:hypothetical protein